MFNSFSWRNVKNKVFLSETCSKTLFSTYLTMKEIVVLVSGASHNFRKVLISETESTNKRCFYFLLCFYTSCFIHMCPNLVFLNCFHSDEVVTVPGEHGIRFMNANTEQQNGTKHVKQLHSAKKEVCVKHFPQLANFRKQKGRYLKTYISLWLE